MKRWVAIVLVVLCVACSGGSDEEISIEDLDGFPEDWPVAVPPGSFDDCPLAAIAQEDEIFSAVFCLPDEPDPVEASQAYLDELQLDGFFERDPGQFDEQSQTFLDGNGIEIFYQLELAGDTEVDRNQATIVLIKPSN